MAYAPQHIELVDRRTGRKFLGPRHYADLFDYIALAPSQRATDRRQVTEPAQTGTATTVAEPARTTTRKTKAEEATR